MGLICKNINKLGKILEVKSSIDIPTDNVKKYTFSDGFIVNIYNTGTITFQGTTSNTKETIIRKIEAINELEKPL